MLLLEIALDKVYVLLSCQHCHWILLSFFSQEAECVAIIGDVATCAYPRIYWSQGFLAPTSCTWETVETFECHHATVMKDSQVYSEMLALQSVNVSYCQWYTKIVNFFFFFKVFLFFSLYFEYRSKDTIDRRRKRRGGRNKGNECRKL